MRNKIYFCTAPLKMEPTMVELDNPMKNYVTVQYLYCGICGGDYSTYIGRRNCYPMSLGHEFVGKVIAIGEDVTKLHIGDYVISDFNYRCGKCSYCLSGKSHLCLKNNIQKFSNRAFAQFGNIHENYLHVIPQMTYLSKACLIEPLSCVIHACKMCKFTPDMRIVINGCGSIGMLFVFYLTQVLSFKNIFIIETNASRKKNILSNFPVMSYDVAKKDSFDYIIECSNSIEGMRTSLDLCGLGGHICIMSHIYGINTSFVYESICKKELISTFPLRNGNVDIIRAAIKYINSYWLDEYNQMLGLFNNIYEAFDSKETTPYNKQIVKL